MPRGENKPHLKSPVIGNNGITASPADLSRLTRQAIDTFIASVNNEIDLHSTESVYNAILGYFQQCERNATRPGNLGLYAALNMSKQDYHNVITGKSKGKASPDCIDLMKKAVRAIGAYRENLISENKINPISYIFMAKNYDGLTDQTQLEITTKPGSEAQFTPEEIAKQIEKDIPLDADYKEVDTE